MMYNEQAKTASKSGHRKKIYISMKSCLKTMLSKKNFKKKLHINVDDQFVENCSSKCLKKTANLNEKLYENNSELKNSKEKLNNDVSVSSKIIRAL